MRRLKGLEDIISISVVDWYLTDKGWSFTDLVMEAIYCICTLFANIAIVSFLHLWEIFEGLRDMYVYTQKNYLYKMVMTGIVSDQK